MKTATIVVQLCGECKDVADKDIEEEIRKELSANLPAIPWATKLVSIRVG